MNIFDGLKDTAFDIIAQTMGYNASWTPSNTSLPIQTARVLFKSNSVKGNYDKDFPNSKMDGRDFDPDVVRMEYRVGEFEGLREAIDQKFDELIVINTVTYVASKVVSSVDGKVFIVDLIAI